MNCLVPDGGSFIRAYDAGTFRSLSNREFIDFLESLEQMPWSQRSKAQGSAHSPFPLRKAPNREPPGRGREEASSAFYLFGRTKPAVSLSRNPIPR